MFFDTHAHYDDSAYDQDRETLLAGMPLKNVSLILNPGCDVPSSEAALRLAGRFPFVYAAAGIHPENLPEDPEMDLERIAELLKEEKCIAIGEIGLDYYWDKSRITEQKEIFRKQLKLAADTGMPVIIHDREAHGDCMSIIQDFPDVRGVFHCYSGSAEMATELLKRGWYLGFDGPVTYKNARKTIEVLEVCPADRILIETDSPYLSPVPMRGKRNDSSNLAHIAAKIAEIKGLTVEEVAGITAENGKKLFGMI